MSMSRSQAARVAAHTRWSQESDRRAATSAGTSAFLARFEKQVDPLGELPADERAKRARNALSAHMTRLRARRRTAART